jgi:hypothetical protein
MKKSATGGFFTAQAIKLNSSRWSASLFPPSW